MNTTAPAKRNAREKRTANRAVKRMYATPSIEKV
jgi:hypothetical protein